MFEIYVGKKLKEIMVDEESNEDSYYTDDSLTFLFENGYGILHPVKSHKRSFAMKKIIVIYVCNVGEIELEH